MQNCSAVRGHRVCFSLNIARFRCSDYSIFFQAPAHLIIPGYDD